VAIGLAELIILGLLADYVLRRVRVPGLVGMLGVGILLGPHVLGLLDERLLAVSSDLRMLALIVILLRAGFELSKDTLHRVGARAALLSCVPALAEGIAVTLLGPRLLGLTYLESAVLGAVLSAVSPAVVVPLMLDFIKRKRGTDQGIPTLVLAASSIDDVFVIVVYSVLIGFYTGARVNVAWKLAGIPVSIILGIAVGLVCGWVLYHLFDYFNPRATKRLLVILGISVVLVALEPRVESHLPFAALLAVMAIGAMILEKNQFMAHEMSAKLAKLWVFAEILLFSLVGAQVDIGVALRAGLAGGTLILLGLVARSAGTWLCLLGSRFSRPERLFIVIAYLPKATVQAAIGGAPLLAMQTAGMSTAPGEVILAVAVLSILLTAPAGAWLIMLVGNRVLRPAKESLESMRRAGTLDEESAAEVIRVDEVMERDVIAVRENEGLPAVLNAFAASDFSICPVVDTADRLTGCVILDDLRPVLASQESWKLLIARDVIRSGIPVLRPGTRVSQALAEAKKAGLQQLPVAESGSERLAGIFDRERALRLIKEQVTFPPDSLSG